jgi:hypothetical protein
MDVYKRAWLRHGKRRTPPARLTIPLCKKKKPRAPIRRPASYTSLSEPHSFFKKKNHPAASQAYIGHLTLPS